MRNKSHLLCIDDCRTRVTCEKYYYKRQRFPHKIWFRVQSNYSEPNYNKYAFDVPEIADQSRKEIISDAAAPNLWLLKNHS